MSAEFARLDKDLNVSRDDDSLPRWRRDTDDDGPDDGGGRRSTRHSIGSNETSFSTLSMREPPSRVSVRYSRDSAVDLGHRNSNFESSRDSMDAPLISERTSDPNTAEEFLRKNLGRLTPRSFFILALMLTLLFLLLSVVVVMVTFGVMQARLFHLEASHQRLANESAFRHELVDEAISVLNATMSKEMYRLFNLDASHQRLANESAFRHELVDEAISVLNATMSKEMYRLFHLDASHQRLANESAFRHELVDEAISVLNATMSKEMYRLFHLDASHQRLANESAIAHELADEAISELNTTISKEMDRFRLEMASAVQRLDKGLESLPATVEERVMKKGGAIERLVKADVEKAMRARVMDEARQGEVAEKTMSVRSGAVDLRREWSSGVLAACAILLASNSLE